MSLEVGDNEGMSDDDFCVYLKHQNFSFLSLLLFFLNKLTNRNKLSVVSQTSPVSFIIYLARSFFDPLIKIFDELQEQINGSDTLYRRSFVPSAVSDSKSTHVSPQMRPTNLRLCDGISFCKNHQRP